MEPTDHGFIDLLKKGDIGAYEKVFTAFFKPLHVYAFLTIKDEALAEEIVQEIFYRVWEKKEKLSIMTAPLGVMRFLANFSTTVSYGVHIVEALTSYPEKFESEATWKELGKPTVTLEQFASSL